MSAKLCSQLIANFLHVENRDIFFTYEENLRILANHEKRELPPPCNAKKSCNTNLFFGFFFDGTKNNYVLSEKAQTLTNVARLYSCHPGRSVPDVLPKETDWPDKDNRYPHFFKVYIPGVASPFKEVKDSGAGDDLKYGSIGGFKGGARIVWAMLQAIKNVHRYFHKQALIETAEAAGLANGIVLDKSRLAAMADSVHDEEDPAQITRNAFAALLARLRGAVKSHWPNPTTGVPSTVDPGVVQKIYISIFGFSRGAVQARAFTNWLMALCKLDAQLCDKPAGMTLGGFEVVFDFLGPFDSVASIGSASSLNNSAVGKIFDGHGAWADTEVSLRVPDTIQCLHLVAAHELRRSFPLDSISAGQMMPAQSTEIVCPGVHSDLGSGYAPREQGRGIDPNGSDMLARIPLLMMYKAARLAGVPFKLELAIDIVKQRYKLDPVTLAAFNLYIAACPTKAGTLTAIMREQATFQMQWHLARRHGGKTPLEASASFHRASTFDQNDLHSANLEFEQEIVAFNGWLKEQEAGVKPSLQKAGFDNRHKTEWTEIARWWDKAPVPKAAILDFFDNYVHDSRAWFKFDGAAPDDEDKMRLQLAKWEAQRKRVIKENAEDYAALQEQMKWMTRTDRMGAARAYRPKEDGLTDNQRAAAEEFGRTGKIPRMVTSDREPFDATVVSAMAGYLRFRKIYAGNDAFLLSYLTDAGDHMVKRA